MIVKNETRVLKRCFDSVVDYIDYWIICDTGSTDGTQNFIKKYFQEKNVPGELLEHKWLNFGHNRTLAVQSAYNKADYLLLMDADFIFCVKDPNFKKLKLNLDSYLIKYEGGLDYRQSLFVSGKKKWRYIGVTHEYIMCDPPNRHGPFDGFTFNHFADGGCRSDKFERDIKLLTDGLKDEPNNARYMFYLAQSHKDLGHYADAIPYYIMRSKSGGWDEEIYYSLYQIGNCMIMMNDDYNKIKNALLRAYKFRPTRLEALYRLVNYCRLNGKNNDGYEHGKSAIDNKYPHGDLLFIERDIHEWKFFDELALCAYNIDKPLVSLKIYKRLMSDDLVPMQQKNRFAGNYKHFKEKYESQIRSEFGSKNKTLSVNDKSNNIRSKNSQQRSDQVTVILNVYKRITIFESQLRCIINQSIKPTEIWVCIFDSPYEKDFIEIINRYKLSYPEIKIISSDINFKYYGRYQIGLQVNTPYICYYDDDRFPNENNLQFYLELVNKKEFKYAILGQWGWGLHTPKYINGEVKGDWEYPPHHLNSTWFQYETGKIGKAYAVDYLCGHVFTHKNNLYHLFREDHIDFSTGEDIRLSFMSYKYGNIISYCCTPTSDTETIKHDEGNVKGSTDIVNLQRRSLMIKEYISNGYKLVADRETSLQVNISEDVQSKICFFCPDYTSIGGSELTIKNLYTEIKEKYGKNTNIIITTDPSEMLSFNPDLVITQQKSISFALDNANKYNYDIFVLIHGPNQFRGYHPRCKLLIYNSDSLMEEERKSVDKRIDRMVLHPTINKSDTRSVDGGKNNKYISFVGSNSYNLIKGSDLFVGLAKSYPDKHFLHVSKYTPVDYKKDSYFSMKIPPVTPSEYCSLTINDIPNLKIVDQTNDISSIYKDTRILVVPSLVESYGRVAVEASINGIPVICSDLPGLHDSTFDLSYYVKDYRNVAAFREAIDAVESNYDYYQDKAKKITKLYYDRQKISLNALSIHIDKLIKSGEKDNNDDNIKDYPVDDIKDLKDDFLKILNVEHEKSIKKIHISNVTIEQLIDTNQRIDIGIIIPIYNRPEYLKLTLESISLSDMSNCLLILIDDCSNDTETVDILKSFNVKDLPIIKIFKNNNYNMYHSLKMGWDILKRLNCKYFCNIDSDVLVKPNWIKILTSTYGSYQGKNPLLTGFNTERNNHNNISETDNYYVKNTLGGVSLFFSSDYYDNFIKFMNDRMWDYNLSYYCNRNNIPLICTKPSVVQHIGCSGLNASITNYDYAYDFFLEEELEGQKYRFYPALDSTGDDIEKMIAADINEMAAICNSNKEAIGFNSNGWLKSKLKPDVKKWDLHDIKNFYGTWVKITN
jgi:glycosyltransferase involved in cell wall biosynthesis